MKENMTQRIKAFIVLLAATVATAGTAWGQSNETLGYINYTQGSDDGGTLTFYRMNTASVYDEIAITNGKSAAIPIARPNENTVTLSPEMDGGNNIGYRIYFKFTPDGRHLICKNKDSFNEEKVKFTVEVTTGTGNHMNAPRRAPGLGDDIAVSTTTTAGLFYFTMPADPNLNVTISVVSAPEKPKLGDEGYDHHNYIDASGNVVNTAALKDGDNNPVPVYWLDGTEPVLGVSGKTTWYYCSGIHDYGSLPFLGDVCIILGDEKVEYSGQKYDGAMLSSLGLGSDGKTLTLLTASGATGCLYASSYYGSLMIPNRYFVYSSSNGYNTYEMYGIRNGSATVAITGDALNALTRVGYLRPFAGRIVSLTSMTGYYVAVDLNPNNAYDYRLSDAHVGNTNYYIYRDPVQTVTLNKILEEGMSIDSGKSIEWSINSVTFTDNINEATGDVPLSLTANLGDAVPTNAYEYIDGQGALRNQDNHYASFTMPASGDVNVSMSLNPFTQPGGYCGNSSVNGGKNLVWTVTDEGTGTDKVRTLTIKKNPDDTAISGQTDFTMADYASADAQPWKAYRSEVVSAVIGSDVTSIGSNAFNGCTNLATVTVNRYDGTANAANPITTFGTDAFNGCTALTTIIVPAAALQSYYNATSWESYKTQLAASGSCGKTESDHVTWTLTRLATGLEVPSAWEEDKDIPFIYNPTEWTTVAAYKLTISGTGAMADYDGEGVTTPWAAADFFFYDVWATYESYSDKSAITELEIGAGITALGSNAFKGLLNLKSLTIADGTELTTIDPYDFFWDNLTTVSLPEEISITVNDGGTLQWLVNSDAWRPYYNQMTPLYGYCGTTANDANGQNLSWTLAWKGEGPESYGRYPLTLTITGTGAMADYGNSDDTQAPWGTDVTILSLPDGLTTIGKYAFYRCTISGALNIPESVISIDDKAFSSNFDLTAVTIPGAKGAEGKALTTIGFAAFEFNQNLATVTLGDGVKAINEVAFQNTYFTAITIPNSVESIGNHAFLGCPRLTTVTMLGETPPALIASAFYNCTSLETIIVPVAGLLSYLGAESWSAYADKLISTGYCGKVIKDQNEQIIADNSHNVIWTLAKNTGDQIQGNVPLTLTISKNPEVTAEGADFSMAGGYPFNDGNGGIDEVTTALSITQAVISDGVTGIGENAFMNCENMATVSIPSSVTSIGACAFVECKSLTSNITIPDGVRVINNSTFNGCEKLTTVVLPSGLTTIGASAFAGCEILNSIGVAGSTTNEMPTSLTAIGASAFIGSGLPAITLNEGLETIAGDAFNRTGLTTINIPASVENIGEGAFTCYGLKSISVAEGNTHFTTDGKALIAHIDDNNKTLLTYARANTETTSYAVPDGVTRIGTDAFRQSRNLTEVTLPEGLKTIGDNAFYDCDAITDIAIPATVESIGTEGFGRCYKLATIRVFRGAANGITTIGEDAFLGNEVTRRIYVPLSALDAYRDNWPTHTPGAANWIFAAPWGDALRGGFCGVDDATTTTVDESKNVAWALTANGDSPEGCDAGSGLTLTITKAAEGQTSYDMADGWPFDDGNGGIDEVTTALSITQAVIGEGVTNIGENAFQNCWNMATVSIPSTVTSIGVSAFVECKSLTSNITIPDGVRVINNSTFNGCEKLTTVVLPSGLTTIGAGAFSGCYKLESIGVAGSTTNALPTSLTAIGTSAFSGSGLPSITLNNGLETIDVSAFSFTNLTTINIPASVENIGEGAFTCNYLESISVADGNTHFITDGKTLIALIDDNNKTLLTYARANTETTSYAVPDGVTRIGADAFSDSDHLTEVILPEGLVTIGNRAFFACDELIDIAIPATVESIGEWCFGLCDKLATFRVFRGDANGITTIGVDAFTQDDVTPGNSSRRIYVPLSALNTYRTAVNWEKYTSWIVAGDETELFSSTATNTWMTWCSNKAYGKPVGCKAYTVSAVNDGEVTLTPVAGLLLPAYTPLLIKRDDTSAALTAIGGAAVTEPESGYNATTGLVTKAETGFSMLGAATDAAITEGGFTEQPFYSLYNGKFYRYEGTQAIAAHRCILTVSPVYTAPVLTIGTETTSLVSIDNGQLIIDNDVWYTLDGRKLNGKPTKKGIYINGGRKVVIK